MTTSSRSYAVIPSERSERGIPKYFFLHWTFHQPKYQLNESLERLRWSTQHQPRSIAPEQG
jgi:hypothetical protein